ncbi:fungal pheromone STE3G-protein-coupled receptor [Schizopora paradoxa]|uniref:Fungal pheromone STE3G-protein-coupled receptor n=1 Tax=Schizopora paradoxa TaxID=27342 RepID=A0A0H2R5J7_9AGAM|nr:fungal pheromone STE3G-protein-coupled receptor [Schizopora paradoxa]
MNGLTPYPITPIGNFIGVILALLPLVSQARKLSVALWGYSIWVALFCFQGFVNSIIWHNNVNVVVPVWCDIVSKIQVGAGIGTHACALTICIQLYKITRLRALPENTTKEQKFKALVLPLLLIIGLPVLTMALLIIVQPLRFQIAEEEGCGPTMYSFVGYIVYYGPGLMTSLGCIILAPFTLRVFLRHRKEMNGFLSTDQGNTHSKYYRLVVVACLDTLFNVPVLLTCVIMAIAEGQADILNHPYISWKNVHDGAGGNAPGLSLSSIVQEPASDWDTDRWTVFSLKWNEWVYVLQAMIFFGVFGTTPEMRRYYRSAFWFIPERLGYKRRQESQTETLSDVAFNSNPNPRAISSPGVHR